MNRVIFFSYNSSPFVSLRIFTCKEVSWLFAPNSAGNAADECCRLNLYVLVSVLYTENTMSCYFSIYIMFIRLNQIQHREGRGLPSRSYVFLVETDLISKDTNTVFYVSCTI